MTRPPLMSTEKKTLDVASILRGEVTMARAARREGVSQTSIAKRRDRFLAGGQAALTDGTPVAAHQSFWFAWSRFNPDTALWSSD